jgi:hypothetical protein
MNISQSFARSSFARFINSRAGRLTRIISGIALIIWGYIQLEHTSGIILILAGIVPLSAGFFDLCIISPLVGGPLSGKKVRAAGD